MKLRLFWIVVLMMMLVGPLEVVRADDPSPEALCDKAYQEIRAFDFKNGYRLYDQALQQASHGGDTWQQAVFGKAICALQVSPPTRELNTEARQLFQQLLDTSPKSRYAPRAMMSLGRIAEVVDFYGDKPDVSTARVFYQKVVDTYPDKPIAGEATFRLATTYIGTYDKPQVRKGIDILMKWLAKHPNDYLATVMWQYMAEAYFRPLGDYVKSLECYAQAEKLGFAEKSRVATFYWRMARMAHRLMDRYTMEGKAAAAASYRAKAIEYYSKIITKAPRSGKAYEVQQILRKTFDVEAKPDLIERLKVTKTATSRKEGSK